MVVTLASVTTFVEQHSQWAILLLFVLLTLESFGLPVPGETALIACAVLASQGSLSIVVVIAVGVLAAIVGDNLGYWAAFAGGRCSSATGSRASTPTDTSPAVSTSSPSTAAKPSSSAASSPSCA